MNVFDEFTKIARKLRNEKMDYALVGGVAMAFHAEPRFTKDIDFLVTPESLETMRSVLENEGYFLSASPWTFKETQLTLYRFLKVRDNSEMMIDVLVGGTDRHRSIVKESVRAKSDYGTVKVASKEDLIWMKRVRNSKLDQADIEKLENDEI